MAVIVTQKRSLWEVARQVKCQIDAGEDADTLADELLAWVLEVADQPMPNPNRCLVEIPDTFAVAHPEDCCEKLRTSHFRGPSGENFLSQELIGD
jgi:hypothetical protein